MRGGCFALRLVLGLAVISIALIVFGGAEIVDGLKYPAPSVMDYSSFVRQHPAEGWYRITGAALDLRHAAYRESEYGSSIERGYVPLRDARDKKDAPIHVLVNTKDPSIIATLSAVKTSGRAANANLWLARDVTGMIKTGINSEGSKTRSDIEALFTGNSLAPDAIFFEDGKSPSLMKGVGLLLGGLALGAGALLYAIFGRRGAR